MVPLLLVNWVHEVCSQWFFTMQRCASAVYVLWLLVCPSVHLFVCPPLTSQHSIRYLQWSHRKPLHLQQPRSTTSRQNTCIHDQSSYSHSSPGATRVNLVWSDKVFLSLVSGSLGHAYHESGGWQLISVGQLMILTPSCPTHPNHQNVGISYDSMAFHAKHIKCVICYITSMQ